MMRIKWEANEKVMPHRCAFERPYQGYSLTELRDLLVAATGNEAAWEEFFLRFDKAIYRLVGTALYRYENPGFDDLVDPVHSIYCRLLEKQCRALRNFRGSTVPEFYRYLSRMIYHLIMEQHRQCKGTVFVSGDILFQEEGVSAARSRIATEPDQERIRQTRELRAFIETILKPLDGKEQGSRDRLVFSLRFYAGYSAKEVARRLNLTPNHVNTIYHRVRKRIMAALAQRWAIKA